MVDLSQVHDVFDHGISRFDDVLIAHKVIDLLLDRLAGLVLLYLSRNIVCLKLLKDLLAGQDLLNLIVLFGLLVATENVLDRLEFFVDYKELALVFGGATTFVNHRYVAFDEVELL